ncbi:hypothetical protein PQX77_002380 [Marasmius sp. AFHP31]|nr:hypothetical protein PQX77_002380 [Marasmius sp. AFHP31]
MPLGPTPPSTMVMEAHQGLSSHHLPSNNADAPMNLDTQFDRNDDIISSDLHNKAMPSPGGAEVEDSMEMDVDGVNTGGGNDPVGGEVHSSVEEEDILDEEEVLDEEDILDEEGVLDGEDILDASDVAMDVDEDTTDERKGEAVSALRTWGIAIEPTYHLIICIQLNIQSTVMHQVNFAYPRFHNPSSSQNTGCFLPFRDPCWMCRTFKGHKENPHWRSDHKSVPTSERSHTRVDCQQFGSLPDKVTYVKIHSIIPVTSAARQQMRSFAEKHDLFNPSEVFNVSDNSGHENPVFSQTKWARVLQDVHMGQLRSSALPADVDNEKSLERLRLGLRSYYEEAVEVLPSLPILTRRYLHSSNPESDLKSQPFRQPQEHKTILKDSDCIARFLSFLIRTHHDPIDNFPVVLHPEAHQLLDSLVEKLEDSMSNEEELKVLLHDVVWKILSTPSDEFRRDELMCPFTRFLIAVHVVDNHGTFAKPQLISPTIACAQWCFRATGALELICIRDEYDGDVQRAYDERVKLFLTDRHTVLFTTLRQHMKFFSALAYRQQGLARFNFNDTMTVVDMDGFPILIADLSIGVKKSLESVRQGMKRVFRHCDFEPILNHIADGMNPHDSAKEKWFHDVPQEDKCRYSLFEENGNGFHPLRSALLDKLVLDSKLFSIIDGKLVANSGACWEWLAQVNDLVKELYFLVCTTWGGGARGTEVEGLLYANHPRRRRNMVFMNGYLTVITEYNKTQSQMGAGKTIARTPSFEVNCLLLLLLSVVYYAAGHISLYLGMRKADAQRYFYEVFVLSGKSMLAEQFSSALGTFTSIHLGIRMGLRDFRQFMACCLIHFTKKSFFDRDDEDMDERWIHATFGHNKEVGEAHYALEISNSGTTLTTTAISHMILVSKRWHEFLGLLHPKLQKGKNMLSETPSVSTEPLAMVFRSEIATLKNDMEDLVTSSSDRVITTFRSNMESMTSYLVNTLKPADRDLPAVHLPIVRLPASVHLRVLQALRQVLRRSEGSPPSFTSPEQAELINSAGGSSHVLGVIETGGGKSLAFFGAACLFPNDLFVVVTPLTALTNDLSRRLHEFAIQGGVYGAKGLNIHTAQLILVSSHIAGTEEFSNWIESSTVQMRLKRVFIDECHKIVTDQEYGDCFKRHWYLTKAAVPITFLTATLMPRSIPYLLETMKISHPSLLEEIRRYTGRPNLKYKVEEIKEETYVQDVKSRVDQLEGKMTKDERGLIFTRTIVQAQTIAKALDIPLYISTLDPANPTRNADLKDEVARRWRRGECYRHRWMSATSPFGSGIDYDQVCYVYVLDPTDILEFAQETGRAGRDGQASTCVALWWRLPELPKEPSMVDHEGRIEMRAFLKTEDCH